MWIVLDDAAPGSAVAVTACAVSGLLDASGAVGVLALDIPIGLAEDGPRWADAAARALVGRQASSVFATPVHAALRAGDHAEAVRPSHAATGSGVSIQAFRLRHRILEVDRWWRTATAGTPRLVQAYLEACFAAMARRPLDHRKKSRAGAAPGLAVVCGRRPARRPRRGGTGGRRRRGPRCGRCRRDRPEAGPHGETLSRPDPPEPTPHGWAAAIWT